MTQEWSRNVDLNIHNKGGLRRFKVAQLSKADNIYSVARCTHFFQKDFKLLNINCNNIF